MADLLEVYGVDLRDLFAPGSGVNPGWVLSLIHGLLPHSRFKAAVAGNPDAAGWTPEAWLAAALINELRGTNYILQAVNTDAKKISKIPEPKPVYTPGAEEERQRAKRQEPNGFHTVAAQMLAATRKKKGG